MGQHDEDDHDEEAHDEEAHNEGVRDDDVYVEGDCDEDSPSGWNTADQKAWSMFRRRWA